MPRRPRLAVIAAALLVALGLQGSASPNPPPGFLGALRWSLPDARFGGFSAIDLSADGTRFVAVTDRGVIVQGHLRRDAQGHVAAVDSGPLITLKSHTHAPLAQGRNDSEGLAVGPDGTVFVSFEGAARVLRYAAPDGLAENLPTPPEFRAFGRNSGLESLAIDAAGALYTIPEEVRGIGRIRLLTGQTGNAGGADFPVWRFADGAWTQPFNLPREGVFLPVSADFGPDGRLYVLERSFRGLAGFASRVRSFTVGSTALVDERLHLLTPSGQHGNLEGMSVWRDQNGALRLTMIADDNFLSLLHTEIVEYRLTD